MVRGGCDWKLQNFSVVLLIFFDPILPTRSITRLNSDQDKLNIKGYSYNCTSKSTTFRKEIIVKFFSVDDFVIAR